MEAPAMAASQAIVPVLFTARPDAPLGGSLASLDGKPADPKLNVPSSFTSTAALVLGQNNVIVWSRIVDRLATAVTEECPYSIEIVEPKVPLVRGGAMGLKVRANRKPGFKSAISVYLPWNPPGVGSAGGDRHSRGTERGVNPHERRRRVPSCEPGRSWSTAPRASPAARSWSRRNWPT